jgi:hypothetical protein
MNKQKSVPMKRSGLAPPLASTGPRLIWGSSNAALTLLALLDFGYIIKEQITMARPFRSAWQTVFVGGLAATAALVIAIG